LWTSGISPVWAFSVTGSFFKARLMVCDPWQRSACSFEGAAEKHLYYQSLRLLKMAAYPHAAGNVDDISVSPTGVNNEIRSKFEGFQI
jgi:hypothetical protein